MIIAPALEGGGDLHVNVSHSERPQLWISSGLVSKLFPETFSKCFWFIAWKILARIRGHIQGSQDYQKAGRLSRRPFFESCQALTMLFGARCCCYRSRNPEVLLTGEHPVLGVGGQSPERESVYSPSKSRSRLWPLTTGFPTYWLMHILFHWCLVNTIRNSWIWRKLCRP